MSEMNGHNLAPTLSTLAERLHEQRERKRKRRNNVARHAFALIGGVLVGWGDMLTIVPGIVFVMLALYLCED